MPFGFKEAGETLRAGGMGIVQSLLQEGARKKEEERLIEREKRQFNLHIKGLDEALKRNKDLYDHKKELDADYKMFGNNLDMKRLYDEAALPTANAEIKALVAGLEAIKFKQQSMISLTEEDYAFKEKLIGLGYEGISLYIDNRELANARLIKQLESREKQYELLAGARLAEAETKREITYRKERTKYRTKQKKEIADINEEISGYKEKLKKEEAKAKKEVIKEDLRQPRIEEEEPAKALKGKKARKFDVPIGETEVTGEMPTGAPLIEYFHEKIRELEEKRDLIIQKRGREIEGTATARAPKVETKTSIPPEIQLVMDELGISFEEAMRFEEERKKKYGIK